jgi:hypothetical protein
MEFDTYTIKVTFKNGIICWVGPNMSLYMVSDGGMDFMSYDVARVIRHVLSAHHNITNISVTKA